MIRFFTLFFFMTCFCSSVHAIESARSKVQLRFKDIGINQMIVDVKYNYTKYLVAVRSVEVGTNFNSEDTLEVVSSFMDKYDCEDESFITSNDVHFFSCQIGEFSQNFAIWNNPSLNKVMIGVSTADISTDILLSIIQNNSVIKQISAL